MAETDLGKVRQTEDEVQKLIDNAITEVTGGMVFMQDGEGKWGYMAPGADTVIPFSAGGGSLSGADLLYSLTSSAAMTAYEEKSVVLEKKYKAIICFGAGFLTSYTPVVDIELITNSSVTVISGFSYTTMRIVFDLKLEGMNEGDTYTVKYRIYSGTRSVARRLYLIGIY